MTSGKRKKGGTLSEGERSPSGEESSEPIVSHTQRLRRSRAPSQKQAEMDKDKCTNIEKQLEKAASKFRKLKQLAKVLNTHDPSGGVAESSEDEFESEEEDDTGTVVAQRKHQSAFESRGIFDTATPAKKRLRRLGDMQVRNTPTQNTGGDGHHDSQLHNVQVHREGPSLSESAGQSQAHNHQESQRGHSPEPSRGCSQEHQDRPPSHPHDKDCLPLHPHQPNPPFAPSASLQTQSRHAVQPSTTAADPPNSVGAVLQPTQDLSTLALAPFRNGQNPSGKPKAGDYADNVTKMINYACHQYEILLATEDPYPAPSTAVAWAARTWTDVLHTSPSKYRLCSRIEKIITSRSLHARGALRDRIRPLIASSYGFVTDGSARAKQQNLARYTYLLDCESATPAPCFYYADLERRQGFAKNSIILEVLKEHWFASADSPGIKYSPQFSPVREVTLALIFTTIEYCLDQWATGLWDKSITFANKVYYFKYQQHLCHIQEWGSLDLESSRQIRQRMYDRARHASGAPPATLPPAGLSDAARERLRLDLAAQVAEGSEDEAANADPVGVVA